MHLSVSTATYSRSERTSVAPDFATLVYVPVWTRELPGIYGCEFLGHLGAFRLPCSLMRTTAAFASRRHDHSKY